jgi:hypothetical protein
LSGSIIPILPKCRIDFTGIGLSTTQDVVLADSVDLLRWREVTVRTRVHSNLIGSGAGSIKIIAVPHSWSDEDPTVSFLESSLTTTATIDSAVSAPSLLSAALTTLALHGFADAIQIFARGSRSAPGAIRADLSIELQVKA